MVCIGEFFTEKICLREFGKKDWADVHKYASQEIVCQYQPWGPNSVSESQDYIQEVLKEAAKNPRTRFAFAIIYKKEERLIGAVELHIGDTVNKNAEIGYVVHPDYWEKGIATDAATLIIKFGFEQLKLHRIYATCDPRNTASAKVLEKVGMTKEGRMRENLLLRDGWRDSLLYSVLEQEWK